MEERVPCMTIDKLLRLAYIFINNCKKNEIFIKDNLDI